MMGDNLEARTTEPLPTPEEQMVPSRFDNLQQIDHYKIVSLLQCGGMSQLYLATDMQTNEPVAIKLLLPKYVSREDVVERFLREAKILSLVDHPNIVKMKGHGRWEGGYYIALEFVMGGSLRQYLLQYPISLKRALEMILEISYAVCHLHTHGIIHRDLKLENILITEEGHIKLIDFGIAQLLDEVKSEDKTLVKPRTIGTPIYMSPEQHENPENVSYPSDIYSLGIIAYELVLGKLSQGHVHLYLMPKGLQKILSKALKADPSERYQDIVDFVADLSAYLNSPSLPSERKVGDRTSELFDSLLKMKSVLMPRRAPSWPFLEVGLAADMPLMETGMYGDFLQLEEGVYAVIFGTSIAGDAEGIISCSMMRGIIRATLKKNISPKVLAEILNKMILEDPSGSPFALCCAIINSLQKQVAYISCGFGTAWHLSKGGEAPELLHCNNSYIGVSDAEYREIVIPFKNEDQLLIYGSSNFYVEIEKLLLQGVVEYCGMPLQQKAEGIMRKVKLLSDHGTTHPFTVALLQRR